MRQSATNAARKGKESRDHVVPGRPEPVLPHWGLSATAPVSRLEVRLGRRCSSQDATAQRPTPAWLWHHGRVADLRNVSGASDNSMSVSVKFHLQIILILITHDDHLIQSLVSLTSNHWSIINSETSTSRFCDVCHYVIAFWSFSITTQWRQWWRTLFIETMQVYVGSKNAFACCHE